MGVVAMARPVYASDSAFDILRAERNISATAGGAMTPGKEECPSGPPGRPLQLSEAVERSLCNNPKTRKAWADVKAQAAAVGVARSAYLPTISGDVDGVYEHSVTEIKSHPRQTSVYTAPVRSANASLNWLLYDFGAREATLRNANALLEAARFTQDATLQSVFASTAKDYYAAQAALGALTATQDVERMTRDSMIAAKDRADKGVAPISDALQAQTQHEEAVLNLTKARGDAQTALGTLASDMDLNPDTPLEIPTVAKGNGPSEKIFGQNLAQLIEVVRNKHPSVRAAQAEYEAALAKVAQTRAQGFPSISLVGKYSHSDQPESQEQGSKAYPATSQDASIGVQVSIPLFEGFGRYYKIHQAKAEAEKQLDTLDDAQRQAALDMWSSYHALTTATQNVANSSNLLDIAQQAWEAARHRYDAGVTGILELLNTQTALANAKQRRVQALADWNNARVDLASKLGRLDAADLEQKAVNPPPTPQEHPSR